MLRMAASLRYGLGVKRTDWQPMERHPRPLRRKNPADMARISGPMLQR